MFDALIRLFKRRDADPPPLTLEQRISMSPDDRELLRLAGEAMRANAPQLAYTAYWRAAQIYMSSEHHLKVLSAVTSILRIAPGDINAHLSRVHALEMIGRYRDAALACLDAAHVFHAAGDRENAMALLSRSQALDPSVAGVPAQTTPVPVAPPSSVVPVPPIVVGTPVGDTTTSTGVIELELDFDLPVEAAPAIEQNTTFSMEALPSALVGSEHEGVARGYLASTNTDLATRTYDQSELVSLLGEADAA
jgi:hypothetical protein